MKITPTWCHLFICVLIGQIMPLRAGIDLDDKRLIRWTTPQFVYQPNTKQLHITLNNVDIKCCGSCRSRGKLVGTYLNPDFKPFEKSFELNGNAPLCRIYKARKTS